MFRFGFRLWMIFNRVSLVLGALLFALILGGQNAERYGDPLEVALPLVAYACAISDGKRSELMARFAAVFFVSHASKRVLGETDINTRPSGGTHGFPSAHTSAATFGASSLVHDCLPKVPALQVAVGLRRDLSSQWSVFGEVKTTYSRHDAELEGGGTLKTDLTTGAFNLGLNWRF